MITTPPKLGLSEPVKNVSPLDPLRQDNGAFGGLNPAFFAGNESASADTDFSAILAGEREGICTPVKIAPTSPLTFPPQDIVEYFGRVSYAANERVLQEIKEHMTERPNKELTLVVTSSGGPTGTAMSFYDTVRSILRVNLTTIASGDVDSSGIIIFLSGKKRYVTTHTTLLLHMAGRTFDSDKRFTEEELGAMIVEDKLKDLHYASIVAAHTHSLTVEKVLHLMKANTVLTPEQLVELGLALKILE